MHTGKHHWLPAAAAGQSVPGIFFGPGKHTPMKVISAVFSQSWGFIELSVPSGCVSCWETLVMTPTTVSGLVSVCGPLNPKIEPQKLHPVVILSLVCGSAVQFVWYCSVLVYLNPLTCTYPLSGELCVMPAVGPDRCLLVPSLPQSQPGLAPGQARHGHRHWRGLSHLQLWLVKTLLTTFSGFGHV